MVFKSWMPTDIDAGETTAVTQMVIHRKAKQALLGEPELKQIVEVM
jgi:hypothetical protein